LCATSLIAPCVLDRLILQRTPVFGLVLRRDVSTEVNELSDFSPSGSNNPGTGSSTCQKLAARVNWSDGPYKATQKIPLVRERSFKKWSICLLIQLRRYVPTLARVRGKPSIHRNARRRFCAKELFLISMKASACRSGPVGTSFSSDGPSFKERLTAKRYRVFSVIFFFARFFFEM